MNFFLVFLFVFCILCLFIVAGFIVDWMINGVIGTKDEEGQS